MFKKQDLYDLHKHLHNGELSIKQLKKLSVDIENEYRRVLLPHNALVERLTFLSMLRKMIRQNIELEQYRNKE